jgi:hypothetical protein
MLGLLLNGCAGQQATVRPDSSSGEAICWDPPPQSSAHPVLDWCKAHPWSFGVGTGVLILGTLAAVAAIALANGAGAGIVMAGMH